ncbi:hypothetical protein L1887_11744 [Cichorium endivia]|nr:hypothetical protein L1887_11744 [Cichorium endivia]
MTPANTITISAPNTFCSLNLVRKIKTQALWVNNASTVNSVSSDIDDVPLMDKVEGIEKNNKETGEEDVDIGDKDLE